jgi:hypothetical protein
MDLSSEDAGERIRIFTKELQSNGMLYGLSRRDALKKCTLPTCKGQDTLLCLQLCLLGPIEYVESPIILTRDYTNLPLNDPMGDQNLPISLDNLLNVVWTKRVKSWSVLFMGCYYLSCIPGIAHYQRMKAIVVYVTAFVQRYRRLLSKQLVFLLFAPAAWMNRRLKSLVKWSTFAFR